MEKIKFVTQRITGLIFWPLVIVVVPYIVAKVGQSFGLWSAIDSQYLFNPVAFWILFVVSRAVYAVVFIAVDMGIHKIGTSKGFFWFAPEREYYSSRPDPIDQSGWIVGGSAALFIVMFYAELAIRLSTMTDPPYLPASN